MASAADSRKAYEAALKKAGPQKKHTPRLKQSMKKAADKVTGGSTKAKHDAARGKKQSQPSYNRGAVDAVSKTGKAIGSAISAKSPRNADKPARKPRTTITIKGKAGDGAKRNPPSTRPSQTRSSTPGRGANPSSSRPSYTQPSSPSKPASKATPAPSTPKPKAAVKRTTGPRGGTATKVKTPQGRGGRLLSPSEARKVREERMTAAVKKGREAKPGMNKSNIYNTATPRRKKKRTSLEEFGQ